MSKKMRQLPITDLARIATMEPSMRLHALRQVKAGGGHGSYRPTRQKLPDIVNRQPGMFESERAPWAVIREDLQRLSKSDREEKMNLRAGKSIYDYCTAESVNARELEGYPLSFSIGLKLVCWSPALFVYPDRIAVPFFDMRRSYALTPGGRKFMYSVMHIALRENNPDYEEVGLEILRLSNSKARPVIAVVHSGDLFSYDELEEMVSDTQNLWQAVQKARLDEEISESEGVWDEGTFFAAG